MLRIFVVVFLVCMSTIPNAYSAEKCDDLRLRGLALDARFAQLVLSYQKEASYFGFNAFTFKDKAYEDAGKHILRMANNINGCRATINDTTCKYVSKEIISLISEGAKFCSIDKKLSCGLC